MASKKPAKTAKPKQQNSSSLQNANANGQQTGRPIDDFVERQIAGNNVIARFKMGSGADPPPKLYRYVSK